MSGDFRNIEAGDADFGSEIVVASTVLPTNARGVIAPHTENCTTEYSVYWDGLYSENPPIASMLTDLNNKGVNVDQLWVIRINPRNRRDVPLSREEIDDRRNELAGNVSFEHGLAQARAMLGNKPIYECALTEDLPIESKVCRSPAFLRELFRMGQDQPWRQL
jgi:NTE family protein